MTSHGQNNGSGFGRSLLTPLGYVEKVVEWSGMLIIVSTLAFTFVTLLVNVFLRYVFSSGIAWAYEINLLSFPWLVAGGIAVASVRGWHISVDALVSIFPAGLRRLFVILVSLSIIVISVSVLMTSGPIIRASKFQRLSEIPVSQYYGYISLYYAFGTMTIMAVIELVRTIFAPDKDTPVDPAQQSFS